MTESTAPHATRGVGIELITTRERELYDLYRPNKTIWH
jgi:hypothetical protein